MRPPRQLYCSMIIAPADSALRIFGIRLVALSQDSAKKLLLTVIAFVALYLIRWAVRHLLRALLRDRDDVRARFWSGQAISIFTTVIFVLIAVSIWFDDPSRLSTAVGLMSAGLAFALQRVITAIAGYVVILRGRIFTVGDRVTIGGVRGDVIALSLTRTTIMEMGQPPAVQNADPAMWVKARQYTGRIVTVTNDKVFAEPVYNYTRGFPYLWEEMSLPIKYDADRARAEQILLEAARHHAVNVSTLGEDVLREMERRYFLKPSALAPQVYLRLTDNWIELTVRFIAHDHGVRDIKDAMSREMQDYLIAGHSEILLPKTQRPWAGWTPTG